jgi:NAD+ diphosphatase
MEIKFCRRCAAPVTQKSATEHTCENGHRLFYASPPAALAFLTNERGEVLFVVRGVEPGKGGLDTPGGFIDAGENVEESIVRELREELHLEPEHYGDFTYLGSGVNDYLFDGEMQRPLDLAFWAQMSSEVEVQPDDDAVEAVWFKLDDVPVDKIAFKTVRSAFEQLKKRLG